MHRKSRIGSPDALGWLGTLLLRPAFLILISYQMASAQTLTDFRRNAPDVVQQWSSSVLASTDRSVAEAERALQLVEQLQEARSNDEPGNPVISLLSHSSWPRAYLDVFRRHAGPYASTASTRSTARSRFGLPEMKLVPSFGTSWPGWSGKSRHARELVSLVAHVLRKEGLPSELLAVPLVESGFNPLAESPKGARGLWQLMPETARRFGLNPDGPFDERLDPYRSSVAAVRYLKELYQLFGDWTLALAAYNAGEERVQHALSKSQARDFWMLDALRLLPEETRQYVPLVLAAADQISESRIVRPRVPSELNTWK